MQKTFLLNLLLLCSITIVTAQIEFEDDFESYDNGFIGLQSTDWGTWSGMVGGEEDGIVTDVFGFSTSGTKSLVIFGNPVYPNGGPTDCILKLGNRNTGRYELSWQMLVNDADGGYFNIQHFETPGTEFAFEVSINSGGTANGLTTGQVDFGGQTVDFDFQRGGWNKIKFIIDMDNDDVEFWINQTMIHSWTFSFQAMSQNGTNQLGGLNFYPRNPSDRYIVDDVKLEKLMPNAVADLFDQQVSVFPTILQQDLQIELPQEYVSAKKLRLEIFNQLGQRIEVLDSAKQTHKVGHLNQGIYYLQIAIGKHLLVRKLVKA